MIRAPYILSVFALLAGCDGNIPGSQESVRTSHRGDISNAIIPKPIISMPAPVAVKPGEIVTIKGEGFDVFAQVAVDGVAQQVQVMSAQELSFIMPKAKTGRREVALSQGDYSVAVNNIYSLADGAYPLITADASKLCSDITYYSAEGKVTKGTRNCTATGTSGAGSTEGGSGGSGSSSLDLSNLKPENIRLGVSVAGVTGTLVPAPADCASDGADACVVVGPLFAAALTTGAESKILAGQTLAGVSGNVTLPSAGNVRVAGGAYGAAGTAITPTLADCSAGGASGCVTTPIYKSMDMSGYGSATELTAGNFNATIATATNFEFWDATGTRQLIAGTPLLTAANVKSGVTIFGVTGSHSQTIADCSADGGTSCVVDGTHYVAADKSAALAANIKSGVALAGVTGTMTTGAPPNCASSGGQACVATGSYYAATACANNGSNCYIPSYVNSSQPLKAISYDAITAAASSMRVGLTLSSVAGTLADCASDGAVGCVAVGPSYAAAVVTGASDKILSGQTLGGVAGNITLPAISTVLSGTQYGVSGTGLAGNVTLPDVANVLIGTNFGPGGTTTGTLTLPTVANVRSSNGSYGVGGAGSTPILADCASGGSSGCVTTSTYKSMNLSALGGATALASTTFTDGSLATAGNFEFWNAAGTRVVVAGSILLAPANVKTGNTIFGVAGAYTGTAPATCAVDGGSNCVVDGTSYVAATKGNVSAGNIKSGVALGGVTGAYPSATYKLPAAAGTDLTNLNTQMVSSSSFQWYDASGTRRTGTGDANIAGGNITSGTTIFGIAGTFDISNLNAGNIKSGVAIGGITGQYPSPTYKLPSYSGTDLTSTAFNSLLASGSTFQWYDGSGTRYTQTGDANLTAGNIKSGTTLFGLTGIYGTACTSDGQLACTTTASYPAAKIASTNLDASNIKGGITIGGVAGQYPSATYPLPGSSGPGLTFATLNAKLASAATFEWFDAAGTRYTAAGDVDLTASNVASGVNMFGITGSFGPSCTADGQTACLATSTYKAVNTSALTAWDIRVGKSAGGIAGSLDFYKNMSRLTTFNRTTGSGSSSSTTTADLYDSIDDYANNGNFPVTAPTAWRSATGAGWTTVTSNQKYKDEITGLSWARSDGNYRAWEDAITYCISGIGASGTYAGLSTWRLPTQKELMQAYVDGIWSQRSGLNLQGGIGGYFYWSATTMSD